VIWPMADVQNADLPSQNITVVGAFNPTILRPAWVLRNLLVEATDVSDPIVPEADGPVIYSASGLFWHATRERLAVYGEPNQIGLFVKRLLDILPHTPLTAAGINLQLKRDCEFGKAGPWTVNRALSPERVLRGRELELQLSHSVHRDDGVRVSVDVVWRGHGRSSTVFAFNYHLDAQGAHDIERAKQLGDHAARAQEFSDDANRILQELLE
jgi:hypothetical protein